jgi:hypothetical protein
MKCDFSIADASEGLAHAMQHVDLAACSVVPVVRGGQLAGILTSERIGELVVMREATGILKPRHVEV